MEKNFVFFKILSNFEYEIFVINWQEEEINPQF